jgi:hypothetical protein
LPWALGSCKVDLNFKAGYELSKEEIYNRNKEGKIHTMVDKRKKIGQLCQDSLTNEQIACLLDVLASSGDLNRYMDDFKKADPDMAATVAKILEVFSAKAGGRSGRRLASDRRTMEFWNSLWRNWRNIVAEVGDEGGKYAIQDHHWEEPYFDGSFLALDLEPIAQDMLELIDDVYDLVDTPDLFSEALDEIEESIYSYPEWMGVEYGEPSELEKNATKCVLKWLWLNSQKETRSGIAFLEKIFEIEESCKMLVLNQNACVEFFVELPDDICREIYTYLNDEENEFDLSNVYSIWHQINHDYESRFDSAKYLETCRVHLADNWRYGRAVIDEALNRDEFQEAESLLKETFSSFLRTKKKADWSPEISLLLGHHALYDKNDRKEISSLLEIWSNVAVKLGNLKRSAAAKLQSVIFRLPEDCDAVIDVYKRLISPKVSKTIDPLLDHWKTEMAERSFSRYMDSPAVSDTWVHWIIDAELDVEGKRGWVLNKLNKWLANLKKEAKIFKKQWQWLARLTKDLPGYKNLQKKYPVFCETVLADQDDGDDLIGEFRRRGLQKFNASPCLELAMEVWRARMHLIVPDPANAYKSDYSDHAGWAKALHELNQDAYVRLLSKWRNKHSRRRNLWRDMKTAGLSI